jgi:hypothetical protein
VRVPHLIAPCEGAGLADSAARSVASAPPPPRVRRGFRNWPLTTVCGPRRRL